MKRFFNQKSNKLLLAFMGLFLIIGMGIGNAQNFTLDGNVTGSDGTALIGASVFAGSQGAITDFEGNYLLQLNASDTPITIIVSYIGYSAVEKDITPTANGKMTYDVILFEDFTGLEEIIVTGTSSATAKKRLGNAVSTVNAQSIAQSGALSIDRALSGKVAGALVNQNSGNPAGGISVTLRGYTTVTGSSDPLYVIDGVIIDNSSPQLIDLGGYAQNRLVDINPNDIERIEILKGAAAAAIYGARASNGVVAIFTKKGILGKPKISFSTSVNVNSLRKEIEENLEPLAWEVAGDPSNTTLLPATRYKMQDYIFDTSRGTDNSISIRGGSENTKYYASGSAFYNEGIIRNTDFSRYSTRLNLDQIINSWISASVGLNFSSSSSNEIPNGGLSEFYGALTGYNFNSTNFNPEADADGNYLSPIGFVPSPTEVIETFKFGQSTRRFIGSFQLKATPFEGFSIEYIAGFDTYTQRADGFIPVGSHGKPTGWAKTGIATSILLNNDLNLRYNTKLSNSIGSNTWIGLTASHTETERLAITSDKLSPVVNSTNAGTVIGRSDSQSEVNIEGASIQQTFSFNDKIFITGGVRVDAASPFGTNISTQVYPKVSFSYLISDEDFWNESLGFINTFKIRAAYGEAGNLTALGPYDKFTNYSPNPIGGQTGLVPGTSLANPDIKPERQKELEIGVDMGLFNNRLGIEFSYYDVEVEDLLLRRIISPSTGFASQVENVGTMTNKGIELGLTAGIVATRDFQWKANATFARNRNLVEGIEGGLLRLPSSFGISVARNGEPLGVLDGFYFARDDSGNIILDANGWPSRAQDADGNNDRKTIADTNPDWVGSLTNDISYKNFSLHIQFDAVQGFEVFNFTNRVNSRPIFGGGANDAAEIRGELVRGYNKAAYNIWERYIEDGSFVKLRELTLAYTLQPKNKKIDMVRFYIQGRNLVSFDNYSGWDPEVSTSGQTNGVRGFDFNEVPIPRTIRFGINMTL